jgi:hypothetical protein
LEALFIVNGDDLLLPRARASDVDLPITAAQSLRDVAKYEGARKWHVRSEHSESEKKVQ